jgi:predicted membrane protein
MADSAAGAGRTGGGEIDMRDARFAERNVTIRVFAIMGGIGITVPEDAEVRASGVGLMGGFNHGPADPGVPGGPVIRVRAWP